MAKIISRSLGRHEEMTETKSSFFHNLNNYQNVIVLFIINDLENLPNRNKRFIFKLLLKSLIDSESRQERLARIISWPSRCLGKVRTEEPPENN